MPAPPVYRRIWLYFTPTATISIDINPSIELGVNRFNRVVSVEGAYNADGVKLAGELSVQYADYMDALGQVLANDTVAALLDADGVLTITVVGPEGARYHQYAGRCGSLHRQQEKRLLLCLLPRGGG